LPEEEPDGNPFELDGLRNRHFNFSTTPEDRIQEVRVKSLRLSIVGPSLGSITFASDARKRRGNIYDLMDKALDYHRLNPDMVKVVKTYKDEELEAVVNYMSRLEWPERAGKAGGATR